MVNKATTRVLSQPANEAPMMKQAGPTDAERLKI